MTKTTKTNREIDALVAEHCMGYSPCGCDPRRPSPRFSGDTGKCLLCGNPGHIEYSANAAASKALRDKMRADGWAYSLEWVPSGYQKGLRSCFFKIRQDEDLFWHDADTEEMAVALAALAAKGIKLE